MMDDSMRKGMYISYDWVTRLYSRNWHNMLNQLYSKKKGREQQRDYVLESPRVSMCCLWNFRESPGEVEPVGL